MEIHVLSPLCCDIKSLNRQTYINDVSFHQEMNTFEKSVRLIRSGAETSINYESCFYLDVKGSELSCQTCTKHRAFNFAIAAHRFVKNKSYWRLTSFFCFTFSSYSENTDHEPSCTPVNTRRVSVGLMLSQRRRRWANIKTTLAQCLMLAGITLLSLYVSCHSGFRFSGFNETKYLFSVNS